MLWKRSAASCSRGRRTELAPERRDSHPGAQHNQRQFKTWSCCEKGKAEAKASANRPAQIAAMSSGGGRIMIGAVSTCCAAATLGTVASRSAQGQAVVEGGECFSVGVESGVESVPCGQQGQVPRSFSGKLAVCWDAVVLAAAVANMQHQP